jgi:glutamate carboxypeptidase
MNDPLRPLTAALEPLHSQALALLQQMVAINSFTTHAAGVDAVGKLTAGAFADLGFTPEFVPSDHALQGHHLFLHKAKPGAPRVLLVTHLDTVFPPEEEVANDFRWHPDLKRDRIYGPGTVDIKGGTVLIWMMLQALKELAPVIWENTDWMIAANAAEEVLSRDFAHHTTQRCPEGVRAVLVFEAGPVIAGRHHFVTARKGRAEYRLTAHGKGAHAGSSFGDGVNAITALAPLMLSAESLSNAAHELTVNVAKVEGGTVLNRVPHAAAFELEMRAFDPVYLRKAGDTLHSWARTGLPAVEVTCLGESPAWPADERNEELASHWLKAARTLGLEIVPSRRGGLSDANYLCHLGPTLDGLGPSGGNAHCSERSADGSKMPEYVEPSSFVPKAAINLLAIMDLLAER